MKIDQRGAILYKKRSRPESFSPGAASFYFMP
jgi:hypothetical protein